MAVVPIRLNRRDARKLDLLVRLGIYGSRAEVIRAMIQAKADEEIGRYVLNEKVLRALDALLDYEKRRGKSPIRIVSKKTVAQIIADGKD